MVQICRMSNNYQSITATEIKYVKNMLCVTGNKQGQALLIPKIHVISFYMSGIEDYGVLRIYIYTISGLTFIITIPKGSLKEKYLDFSDIFIPDWASQFTNTKQTPPDADLLDLTV